MLVGLVSSETSLLDADVATVSLCPHMDALLCVCTFLVSPRVSNFSLLIRTPAWSDYGSSQWPHFNFLKGLQIQSCSEVLEIRASASEFWGEHNSAQSLPLRWWWCTEVEKRFCSSRAYFHERGGRWLKRIYTTCQMAIGALRSKNTGEKGLTVIGRTLAVLHKMTRESFSDMLTFKQRPEGSREMNRTYI